MDKRATSQHLQIEDEFKDDLMLRSMATYIRLVLESSLP